jgi:metallo-beta-lactamase family protein
MAKGTTTPNISFLGAAETVTGSRYLVETGEARVLVECGLFQGWKRLRERNWSKLPFDPSALDAVVLTHAHIDHSGYLPRLRNMGFSGPAYCTAGTLDLLKILLPDSGHLQEEEARYANKRGYSKHHPALPLYTREDAENTLPQLQPKTFYEKFALASGISARFTRAGHIIGSACLELQIGTTRVTFTGDVGRPKDLIMRPPDPLGPTDFLVTESTYGDRLHPTEDPTKVVAEAVARTANQGGVILVPAFAVGRTQHLLHMLAKLKQSGQIPDIPVFLDSPMAIDATELFRSHMKDHALSAEECRLMYATATYSHTPNDSKAIDRRSGPMVVVSASGMATGGRILHHLAQFLPGKENTVLIVGFQAAGTRGRSLLDGAEEVKLLGGYVPVRARIVDVPGLSAHADYREMIDWLKAGTLAPRHVFVTHGEPAAADAFRRRLHEAFGWTAVVPSDGERWPLR